MSTALALPALDAGASLSRYLAQINRFPILGAEDEYMLAKRWQEHGDTKAAHTLVTSHLRLVVKIAGGYRGYGLPLTDLISEGNLGLMTAVRKFEPDRGFRLSTYAMWWIKATIQEYILRSWSLVRLGTTAAQKKLFFDLARLKRTLAEMSSGDLKPESVTHIAHTLDVREADVVAVNRRLTQPVASLNALMSADSEGQWQDLLADERPSAEEALLARSEGTSPHAAAQGLGEAQRAGAGHSHATTPTGRAEDAGGAVTGVRRQLRAHPADRGACLPEGRPASSFFGGGDLSAGSEHTLAQAAGMAEL